MLNATRRESHREPTPLVPGEIYQLNIEIDATGWVFKKGHCIRLSLASADWPNVWPTPNPATNHVYRGPTRPSRLILPVVPAHGSAAAPQFQPSSHTVATHSGRVNPPTWEVTRAVLTGRTTVNIANATRRRLNETTGFEYEYDSSFQVAPDNPAQATAHGRHTYRIKRPSYYVQSQADVSVQATDTHFHIVINLDVTVNDAPHFTRRWVESVPRNYL
jgi:hypothetical protein